MDNVSIRLKNGRLSFYTMVPVLYSGIVRAEYYFDKGEKTFHYEEYPYIDGRLGESGLKRNVLGRFDEVKFYALKDGTWTEELSEKDKTGVIKMVIDGQDHYLVLE
ncbi:MAG: hypothetical protein N3C60_03210 [Calditerrivibrio sp.]|nr:hypothetical protein [Calditerrivibrio sp.]